MSPISQLRALRFRASTSVSGIFTRNEYRNGCLPQFRPGTASHDHSQVLSGSLRKAKHACSTTLKVVRSKNCRTTLELTGALQGLWPQQDYFLRGAQCYEIQVSSPTKRGCHCTFSPSCLFSNLAVQIKGDCQTYPTPPCSVTFPVPFHLGALHTRTVFLLSYLLLRCSIWILDCVLRQLCDCLRLKTSAILEVLRSIHPEICKLYSSGATCRCDGKQET